MIEKIDTLFIEILDSCNFFCKHCYNSSGKGKYVISVEQCKKIEKILKKYNLKKVVISGGEPLLHKNLIEIIRVFEKYSIRINTNGYYLDMVNIDKIIDINDKICFQISLDGYDKKSYKFVRNNDSFDRIINNAEILKNKGISVYFKTVLVNETIDMYRKFIELAEKVDIPIKLGLVCGYGEAKKNGVFISEHKILSFMKEIHTNHLEKYLDGDIFRETKCRLFLCPEKINILKIGYDGNVYPCIMFMDENFSIGNINYNNLDDLLSESYYSFLKKYYDMVYNCECLSCGYRREYNVFNCLPFCSFMHNPLCKKM